MDYATAEISRLSLKIDDSMVSIRFCSLLIIIIEQTEELRPFSRFRYVVKINVSVNLWSEWEKRSFFITKELRQPQYILEDKWNPTWLWPCNWWEKVATLRCLPKSNVPVLRHVNVRKPLSFVCPLFAPYLTLRNWFMEKFLAFSFPPPLFLLIHRHQAPTRSMLCAWW